jgi:mannose-6-phosphate isomerase-like protein (cupin superfamily)
MRLIWLAPLIALMSGAFAYAQEGRTVDPTWMHRFVPDVAPGKAAIASPTAKYIPLFGEGDSRSKTLQAVTRFGEIQVDAKGKTALIKYPREENMLVILSGAGTLSYNGQQQALKAEDYVYLPAGVEFGLAAGATGPVTAVLMGYKIPESMPLTVPPKLMMANFKDVPLVDVGGHPDSVKYRLLMGDTKSTRDKLSTGHLMISLFIMEFQPGGTNFPHHHATQEEIYLVLDGTGQMVAGGGMDGIEAKFPAKPGDAYYYRPNTTVGFYADAAAGPKPARILAVRNDLPPAK